MADNDIVKQKKAKIISPQEKLFKDACSIIEQAKAVAYRFVNDTLIKRNWFLGLRIQHEVLKDQRAEYGEQVIMKLAEELIDKTVEVSKRATYICSCPSTRTILSFSNCRLENPWIWPTMTFSNH